MMGDSGVFPTESVVAKAKIASPLRLQYANDFLERRGAASQRRRHEEVQKAEHHRGRRRLLVREWIATAPGMMQSGRRLESNVVLGARRQKTGDVQSVGKRLRGYASGANLCAHIGRGNWRHERRQVAVRRHLHEK